MKPSHTPSLFRRCCAIVLVVLLLPAVGIATAADKVVVVPLIDTIKGVPKTGQTTCYANDFPHPVIPCAGTGQDGEFQKGIPWPAPRFTLALAGRMAHNAGHLPDQRSVVGAAL